MANGNDHRTCVEPGCKCESNPPQTRSGAAESVSCPSSYFTLKGNFVDGAGDGQEIDPKLSTRYEVAPHRCKCAFCPNPSCHKRYGIAIRKRLQPAIDQWEAVMMLTLTLDPKL